MSWSPQQEGALKAVDEIDADYDSAPLEIGFNAAYLADLLSHIAAETVRIEMAESGSPTLFRADGDIARLIVLMPMRV